MSEEWTGRGGGYSLVSVVNRGTGAERRENNSCGQDGIVSEREPYTGRSLAATSLLSPFSESSRILDTLRQLLPDLETLTAYNQSVKQYIKGSVHPNYKEIHYAIP